MISHSGFLSQFEQFIGSSNKQEGKLRKILKKIQSITWKT